MHRAACLFAAALFGLGCDNWSDFTGKNDFATRLALSAAQRQLTTEPPQNTPLGIEISNPVAAAQYCVRIKAQLGSFSSGTPASPPMPDGGTAQPEVPCPADHCALLLFPQQGVRRTSVVYQAGAKGGNEMLLAELYYASGTTCTGLKFAPITVAQLTLVLSNSGAAADMKMTSPTDMGIRDGSGGDL